MQSEDNTQSIVKAVSSVGHSDVRARQNQDEQQHQSDWASRSLWAVALGSFVVGDAVSTAAGLAHLPVHEAHPIGAGLLAAGGPVAMLAGKALVVGLALGIAAFLPRAQRIGVPIGLALVGTVALANNLAVLAVAGGVGA
jgi:hypothetical protein